jgi:hypothetical protein
MKKLIYQICFLIQLLFLNPATGQNFMVSDDEINLHRAEMYGIIGKINDRVQLYLVRDNKLFITAYGEKLHKLGEREIELEKKGNPQLLDIVTLKNDFNAIFYYTKKNRKYLKINKYDVHGRLIDSATIHDFGRTELPKLELSVAEDRQRFLVYGFSDLEKLVAVAGRLDSLKTLWHAEYPLKNWNPHEDLKQIVFNNYGSMYVIWEKNNRLASMDKHFFCVKKYGLDGERLDTIRMTEALNIHVKFAYDNQNQRLIGAGFYSKRWNGKIQGTYYMNMTQSPQILLQPFENEFIAQALGKKETDAKGLENLYVRELILRKDGGFLMLSEQAQDITRYLAAGGFSTAGTSSNYPGFGAPRPRAMSDHYYDDFYLFSFHAQGNLHWKKILHKKQYSHDDDGHFSSGFVMKTPGALRLIYNDEVERETTVSEYALKGDGSVERHSVMNTASLDVLLRFRDAVQIGANELLVPSEMRGKARLVKIIY